MSGEFNVAVVMKIYLDDFSKAGGIKDQLHKSYKVSSISEEEIGFGIKILRVSLLLKDDEGGIDDIEEFLEKLPHVTQVQVEEISRI